MRTSQQPHQAHKLIDYDKLAIFWNQHVYTQSRVETDSNKRLYYKLPAQLERHYKRVLTFKSERATILLETNAAALKAFRDLLTDDNNTTVTLPAQNPPELPTTVQVDQCYDEVGK
jgi:hypothetical protein